MKFNKIAILGETKLPLTTREEIALLSNSPVDFSTHDLSSDAKLVAHTANAEAALVDRHIQLTRSYFEQCPNLKYLGVCATTTAGIDLQTATDKGITLKNVTDYGDEATAEYIFMQLLMLVRGASQYSWRESTSELNGKSIGIIGLGAVGQQVARLALGFNMRVQYHSRTRKPDWEARGLQYLELPDLLASSNIISVNVPRDLHVLGDAEFGLIRPGSILVQTSIGAVIDETAFRSWIAQPTNFAIFDYSVGEKHYNALKDLPRVIFPKVIAGYTLESLNRLGEKVLANLKAYLANS